ncbi:MAG: hypothetical protein ABIP39_04545, partial [Polyangiaceae bacterium]
MALEIAYFVGFWTIASAGTLPAKGMRMSAEQAAPEEYELPYTLESLVVPRPERATYRPMADQAPQQSTLTQAPPILAPGPHLIVFIQGGVKAHPLNPGRVVTVGRSADSEI